MCFALNLAQILRRRAAHLFFHCYEFEESDRKIIFAVVCFDGLSSGLGMRRNSDVYVWSSGHGFYSKQILLGEMRNDG